MNFDEVHQHDVQYGIQHDTQHAMQHSVPPPTHPPRGPRAPGDGGWWRYRMLYSMLCIMLYIMLYTILYIMLVLNVSKKQIQKKLLSTYGAGIFPQNPLGEIKLPQRVPTDSEDFEEKSAVCIFKRHVFVFKNNKKTD